MHALGGNCFVPLGSFQNTAVLIIHSKVPRVLGLLAVFGLGVLGIV